MLHHSLSPIQIQKFTTLFRHYDRDSDGYIDIEDFVVVADRAASLLGFGAGSDHRARLIAYQRGIFDRLANITETVDTPMSLSSYLVSFASLAASMAASLPPECQRSCQELMSILGGDQYPIITIVQYTAMLRAIGSTADPEPAFQRLDRDDDGALILSDLESLTFEFVTSNDPDAPGNWLCCGTL
jgi:EF-hand domain pair